MNNHMEVIYMSSENKQTAFDTDKAEAFDLITAFDALKNQSAMFSSVGRTYSCKRCSTQHS